MGTRFFKKGGYRYSFRLNRGANRGSWFIMSIIILVLLIVTTFTVRLKPVLTRVAESRAYNIGLMAINECINNRLGTYWQEYSKLVVLEKDSDGNVTALRSNINEINRLKSILSTDISSKISQIQATDVRIPLGSLLGSDIFAGQGPYISIRLVPVSSVYVDFQDSFSEAGINQTMHEISLKVDVNIGVLMPAMKTYVKVSTVVPISNTILLGKVPTTYTHIAGTTGSPQDKALNIVDK